MITVGVPRGIDERISRHGLFMSIASLVSLRSTCQSAQVGAVIVRESRIISIGYNGSPSGQPHCLDEGCLKDEKGHCIRTVHAEANAIAWAAREGIATKGATMYVTLSPCRKCAELIINAGIRQVIYSNQYHDPSGIELLKSAKVVVDNYGKTQQVQSLLL